MLTTLIFALNLYNLLTVHVQSSGVPYDEVWTLQTATLWLGEETPSITCTFQGTPFGVYWMKGLTPSHAQTFISWYDGKTTGSGVDDGSYSMSADFSLIFHQLKASDEGRYLCGILRLSHDTLIYNHTDVRVLDPQFYIARTIPSVTGWKGSSVRLPCDFKGNPTQVLWNTERRNVLRYTGGSYEVIGGGHYTWSSNFSLFLRDLKVLDEGNFTCQVWKAAGIKLQNMTRLTVNAYPEKPYIKIKQCKNQTLGANSHAVESYCRYNITGKQANFQLDCSVRGAKPLPYVSWEEPDTERLLTNITSSHTARTDGTIDIMVTLRSQTSAIGSEKNFTCIAAGSAVNGTAKHTIGVYFVSAPGKWAYDERFLPLLILIIVPIAICGVLCFKVCTKIRPQTVSQEGALFTCSTFNTDDYHQLYSGQPDVDKVPLLPTSHLPNTLDFIRKKINHYQPGDVGEYFNQTTPVVNIGLFGVTSPDKSALISSLAFALSGVYRNTTEDEMCEVERQAMFRKPIQLTDHIKVLDIGGMSTYDGKVAKEIMTHICNERVNVPVRKIRNGKEIHCPVVMFNVSDKENLIAALTFVKNFSKKVHDKSGRHAMVVTTFKGNRVNLPALKAYVEMYTGVPQINVWPVENYTEQDHIENPLTSMKFLEFIWACLELGEKNMELNEQIKTNTQFTLRRSKPFSTWNFSHHDRNMMHEIRPCVSDNVDYAPTYYRQSFTFL